MAVDKGTKGAFRDATGLVGAMCRSSGPVLGHFGPNHAIAPQRGCGRGDATKRDGGGASDGGPGIRMTTNGDRVLLAAIAGWPLCFPVAGQSSPRQAHRV